MFILHLGWFDLSAQLAFEVAGTENSIYRGTALRSDVVLLAGHYGRRWFAVGEAGYDRAWLTYIRNSDWYRDTFYAARSTAGTAAAVGTCMPGPRAD